MNEELNIVECLKKIKINKNDLIMIHGNAAVAAQYSFIESNEKKLDYFFHLLKKFIGSEGTLIIPTFTYSFTDTRKFNNNLSKSEVGLFSEFFRKKYSEYRTNNPMYSVALLGNKKKYFSNIKIDDCFGKDSIFQILYEMNAKIICLGCEFDRITFTHFVEENLQVKYRFYKSFNGEIILKNNKVSEVDLKCYVRSEKINAVTNLDRLKKLMEEKNKLYKTRFGRFEILSVSARDFYNCSKMLLKENPFSLIQEGLMK